MRAEAQKGCGTFRMVKAEAEPNERTEVVGDQPDPPNPERVEQRQHVGENLIHGVPVGRCVRPTSAAKIRRDHAVTLGKPRDDLAPLPPMLREAVQEQNRRGTRVPGLGDVHPQAGRQRDKRMGHAWKLRHVGRLRGARPCRPAGRVRRIGHHTLVLHSHRQFTTRDPRPGPWFIMDGLLGRLPVYTRSVQRTPRKRFHGSGIYLRFRQHSDFSRQSCGRRGPSSWTVSNVLGEIRGETDDVRSAASAQVSTSSKR